MLQACRQPGPGTRERHGHGAAPRWRGTAGDVQNVPDHPLQLLIPGTPPGAHQVQLGNLERAPKGKLPRCCSMANAGELDTLPISWRVPRAHPVLQGLPAARIRYQGET